MSLINRRKSPNPLKFSLKPKSLVKISKKISEKTTKLIQVSKGLMKKCPVGSVFNPKTKRCVKIGGAAYKKWVSLGVIDPIFKVYTPVASLDFFTLDKLPFDLVRKTMIDSGDINLILNLCSVSKKFQSKVCNDDFWRLVAKSWHGIVKNEHQIPWKKIVMERRPHQIMQVNLSEKGKITLVAPNDLLQNIKVRQLVRLAVINTTPELRISKFRDRDEFNVYAIIDSDSKLWYYDTLRNKLIRFILPEKVKEVQINNIWVIKEIISSRNMNNVGTLILTTLSGVLLSGNYRWLPKEGSIKFDLVVCDVQIVGIKSIFSSVSNYYTKGGGALGGTIVDSNGGLYKYIYDWKLGEYSRQDMCPTFQKIKNIPPSVQVMSKLKPVPIITTQSGEVWTHTWFGRTYFRFKIPVKITKTIITDSFVILLDHEGSLWYIQSKHGKYTTPTKTDLVYKRKIKGVIKTEQIKVRDISLLDLIPYDGKVYRSGYNKNKVLIIDSKGDLYKLNPVEVKLTKTGQRLPIDKNPHFDLRTSEFIYLNS